MSGGVVTNNPFDLVSHRAPVARVSISNNATEIFRPFAVLPRGGGLSSTALFTILALVLGFLTFSVAVKRSAVEKAWRGFLSDSSLTFVQREAFGLVGNTPYYLMYINFLLNAGLFIFLVTKFFKKDFYNNTSFLLLCIVGAALFFLSKHVMLYLMRLVFPLENELKRYHFLIIIFNCVLGLFLLPFNFFIAFSANAQYQGLLVFWMLGLVTVFFMYRALRALKIGTKFLSGHSFHFLLYLCVVEIAPLLLIMKLATMQS